MKKRKKENVNKGENVQEKISEYLELPKELLSDIPKIVIYDNKEISIENFKGILEYDQSNIRVNTRQGVVLITGNTLEIKNITDEEIEIKGTLQKIEFIY